MIIRNSAIIETPREAGYEELVAYGFSPAKAGEILLDAKRGIEYAKNWLRIAREYAEPVL